MVRERKPALPVAHNHSLRRVLIVKRVSVFAVGGRAHEPPRPLSKSVRHTRRAGRTLAGSTVIWTRHMLVLFFPTQGARGALLQPLPKVQAGAPSPGQQAGPHMRSSLTWRSKQALIPSTPSRAAR